MLRSATALALAGVLLAAPASAAPDDLAARARKLHKGAIIVDTHIDTPDQLSEKWADLKQRGATDHIDIPRMREGGLTAGFFSIYVASSYADSGMAAGRALELIDLTRRAVRENPRDLTLATSVADIRAAKKAGKIAVLMGMEGGHGLENSLGAMRELHHAGVRYVTLTHTNTNDWGHGPPRRNGGRVDVAEDHRGAAAPRPQRGRGARRPRRELPAVLRPRRGGRRQVGQPRCDACGMTRVSRVVSHPPVHDPELRETT